ncbi:FTR1 family iron permease [Tumebacillus flagellatus]|uniref:Iron permease n=1 Tax=Tumebacillus flagellatus TaxID=1157490 RepID=A0A074LVB0_9BACL|nr:FTR1 family protein [Tumebacillus flagellatus]KEO84904.1 hypothetical protein EL26_02520 [Tumebacillus flagellatus]
MANFRSRLLGFVLALLLVLGVSGTAIPALAADPLLPLVGNALTQAKAGNWQAVNSDLQQFETTWQGLSAQHPEAAQKKINDALAAAKQAARGASPDPSAVNTALANLAKATDALADDQAAAGNDGTAVVKKLEGYLQQAQTALEQDDLAKAKSQYKLFDNNWTKAESAIRNQDFAIYSKFETHRTLATVALNAETVDKAKAKSALQNLLQDADNFLNSAANGNASALNGNAANSTASDVTLSDAIALLTDANSALQSGDAASASDKVQQFITLWPSVEGAVSARSGQAYSETETKMTQALQDLTSTPPNTESAVSVLQSMITQLQPFADRSHYTAWDAGIMLFREGLEALLVVAALLAFLQRTGNRNKQKWIWAGVGSGLGVSVVFAGIMSLFFSSLTAGGNREVIEGVTGLIAVVMMFTVGVWLHSKSSSKAWNSYISTQMSAALAGGSLWSLALISFLAIAREGAETILFYLGMAASIEKTQLFLGIGVSLAVLLLIGFAILKFAVRIPLKPFFSVASLLIYYIAFKFLGQSVHVLQIQDWFSVHTLAGFPTWEWLGLYPTWETTGAQVLLIVLILLTTTWNNRRQSVSAHA